MSQLGQAPKPAEHGSFLHQESVAGRRVEFVQKSNFTEGSVSIPAGLSGSFDIELFVADEAGNIIPYDNIVAWHYADIFVDTNDDFNYEFRVGASLNSGQANMHLTQWYTQEVSGASQRTRYVFRNNDTNTHTIYMESEWKYILTA